MGKAARIKRARTEPFFHEQKRPTGTYMSKSDQRQVLRKLKRAVEEQIEAEKKQAQTEVEEVSNDGK